MSGLISPLTLEQIRSANSIVDVIGGYFPLKRAGANFVALCPFHKERTPSFHVNPHRQTFHCFGCNKGGDVFRFVQEYESLSFVEAVRRLAERARIPIEFDSTPGGQRDRQIKEVLLDIHEKIAQRWHHALLNEAAGQAAREYLAKRGVSEEAITIFRLGCAPEAWDDTVNWAKSKRFDLGTMVEAGLVLKKDDTGHYYDRFRGRLMFPISDESGRVIAFSGRIIQGDEKSAKYVNSPETPIFSKGRVFFGLDKTKRAILDAGHAIICEGQLDLIACYMAGVRAIVAPQGTAFTNDHARILKRYVDEVILCFDSDTAGQSASVRVLDALLASGLAVRVATIPSPHDPDSFIKQFGGAAFQQIVDRAENFFDYYLGRLCEGVDLGADRGRNHVVSAMAAALHKTGNVVLVDTYAQKTSLRLGVAAEAVRTEFKKVFRSAPGLPRSETEDLGDAGEAVSETSAEVARPSAQEFWLLKILLTHDNLVGWAAQHLDLAWIQHPAVKRLVQLRLQSHADGTWVGLPAFLDPIEDAAARGLVTEMATEPRPIPNPDRQLRDAAVRLRDQSMNREIAALNQQLQQAEIGEARRLELLARQQSIRRARQLPLA